MSEPRSDEFLGRLDVVQGRLGSLAAMGWSAGLTDPDAATGERWEWGQVWAHTAEFIPFWLDQIDRIRRAPAGGPVPFGRTKSDRARLAAIERDRDVAAPELWPRIDAGIDRVRSLLQAMTVTDWERAGAHSTLGTMTMSRIVDEFLVGHLEEHAAQLEGLLRSTG